MLKVEFVCDFRSAAGYSAHARLMMRALDKFNLEASGISLRILDRPKEKNTIALTQDDERIYQKYNYNNSFEGKPDVRLFFEPAQWYFFEEDVKTIGFCQWEATSIRSYAVRGQETTNWVKQLNSCDMVISSCVDALMSYINSGVRTDSRCIPGPYSVSEETDVLPIADLTVNAKSGKVIPWEKRPVCVGYMAQWTPRKNVEAFIRDFTIAFEKDEAVAVLKTYGASDFAGGDDIVKAVKLVRDSCRKRTPPPRIVCITEKLTDADVDKFFNMVDIYYAPSRGEGYNMPLVSAIGAGCIPLTTAFGGPKEYLDEEYLIKGSFSPCLGMGTYDSDQYWMNIDEKKAVSMLMGIAHKVRLHKDGFSSEVLEEEKKIRIEKLKESTSEETFSKKLVDAILHFKK